MEAFGGPAQPSPTVGAMLNGGYGLMEVNCHRRSFPLDAVRSPRAIR
jgi:hypothetical protein